MMNACKWTFFPLILSRFFTPTIHGMREEANLYLLVLTNGGYDGLGKIREKEQELAAKYQQFKDSRVLND